MLFISYYSDDVSGSSSIGSRENPREVHCLIESYGVVISLICNKWVVYPNGLQAAAIHEIFRGVIVAKLFYPASGCSWQQTTVSCLYQTSMRHDRLDSCLSTTLSKTVWFNFIVWMLYKRSYWRYLIMVLFYRTFICLVYMMRFVTMLLNGNVGYVSYV